MFTVHRTSSKITIAYFIFMQKVTFTLSFIWSTSTTQLGENCAPLIMIRYLKEKRSLSLTKTREFHWFWRCVRRQKPKKSYVSSLVVLNYRRFLYESKKPLANIWVVVWSSGVPESGGFLKIDVLYNQNIFSI